MFNPFAAFVSPKPMQSDDIFEMWDDAHPQVQRAHVATSGGVLHSEKTDRALQRDHLALEAKTSSTNADAQTTDAVVLSQETQKAA